jgi:cytochrome P450
MSATSLGGSFNLVSTNNTKLKKTFMSILMKGAINGQFPYLRYLPFWPEVVPANINKILDDIIHRRETTNHPARKDLVQILLDAHQADPVAYPEQRVRDDLTVFMYVSSVF